MSHFVGQKPEVVKKEPVITPAPESKPEPSPAPVNEKPKKVAKRGRTKKTEK